MHLQALLARAPPTIFGESSAQPADRLAEPILPADLVNRQIRLGNDHQDRCIRSTPRCLEGAGFYFARNPLCTPASGQCAHPSVVQILAFGGHHQFGPFCGELLGTPVTSAASDTPWPAIRPWRSRLLGFGSAWQPRSCYQLQPAGVGSGIRHTLIKRSASPCRAALYSSPWRLSESFAGLCQATKMDDAVPFEMITEPRLVVIRRPAFLCCRYKRSGRRCKVLTPIYVSIRLAQIGAGQLQSSARPQLRHCAVSNSSSTWLRLRAANVGSWA